MYQAQLSAVSSANRADITHIEVKDFWLTDSLEPVHVFPNIAMSPRNKPAEAILRHWFKR